MATRMDTGHRSLGSLVLLVGLVGAAIASAVWANLWKSDLRVADITVVGNSIVTDKEILSLARITTDQKLYAVDLSAAQRRVLHNAFVRSVAVNREAPDRISITIDEREPIAALALQNMEYLDADGVILPATRSENIFDLPVLTVVLQANELVPGRRVMNGDAREALAILSTARDLSDELYRRISEVHVEPGKDIILYTAEFGVPVVFGRGDHGIKLVKLDGFWREIVLHRGAQDLNYVDLRFEEQVVVRWNHDNTGTHTTETAAVKSSKQGKS